MLEPYQQRVVEEKAELDSRISSLTAFMPTETFKGLPEAERRRMGRQWWLMTELSQVLGERIAAFH